MSIPCTRLHLLLAIASALVVAALCSAVSARAEERATGKIVIFQASNIANIPKLIVGEPATPAKVFDKPAYGCIDIPRSDILGVGGHNLFNLTNATIDGFSGLGCRGLPATSTLAFPPLGPALPNNGVHIDFANSIRVRKPDTASSLFGEGLTVPVSLFTGLPSGSNPLPDAPLQFMPTPDGRLAADPNPRSAGCKPINPIVHNVYNASTTDWVYTWLDPDCTVPAPLGGAVAPGYISHIVANPILGYSVSSVAPGTRTATASVRAVCRQRVSRSASRRVKARARTRVATCEKAAMWGQGSTASASRR